VRLWLDETNHSLARAKSKSIEIRKDLLPGNVLPTKCLGACDTKALAASGTEDDFW
jgi:hypothetical protein